MHFYISGILKIVLLPIYASNPERYIDTSLSKDKKVV